MLTRTLKHIGLVAFGALVGWVAVNGIYNAWMLFQHISFTAGWYAK